jgi:8-oxo-dGTP diphosphatase
MWIYGWQWTFGNIDKNLGGKRGNLMNSMPTVTQVSAGGVVYRQNDGKIEVALILVGPKDRWQLPKGAVNPDEKEKDAAQREVREETGLETELLHQIERIEYWFYAQRGEKRTRFHKFVIFFLMRYRSGHVNDHDDEVLEARWVEINQAIEMLAYESEKGIVRKAKEWIEAGHPD